MERRDFGETQPEVLLLACEKIVPLPVELYTDGISVKKPQMFIVEGVNLNDPRLKQGLPFEPTHVGYRDPATQEEVWFCVIPAATSPDAIFVFLSTDRRVNAPLSVNGTAASWSSLLRWNLS